MSNYLAEKVKNNEFKLDDKGEKYYEDKDGTKYKYETAEVGIQFHLAIQQNGRYALAVPPLKDEMNETARKLHAEIVTNTDGWVKHAYTQLWNKGAKKGYKFVINNAQDGFKEVKIEGLIGEVVDCSKKGKMAGMMIKYTAMANPKQ